MKASIIDIGTNSCRLLTAENIEHKIKPLTKIVKITRLGEGVNHSGILNEEAILRTLKVLEEFKNTSNSLGAEKILAFATSAVRDAKNRNEFIDLVMIKTGIKIKCISGIEEGEAAFTGGTSFLKYDSQKILLLDIGGGSTEFSYGKPKKLPEYVKSLNLGVVRFKEMMEEKSLSFDELGVFIQNELRALERPKDEYILMGVAASITGQIALYFNENYNSEKVQGYKLEKEMVKRNFEMLKRISLEDIKSLPSVHPKRADVLLTGTYLLLQIFEYLKKDYLITSELDSLEGHFILNIINSE